MRFLALEQLIQRGLLNSARKLVQRIIKHSSSAREAVSAADFAVSSGVEFDMRSYDFLIRKLATCGEARMAEAVYVDFILSRGIEPDHYLLNSMVVCYSKLGKLEEAKSQFDTLIAMEIMPCRAACSEIICEFCAKKRVLEGFHVFLQVRDAEFLLNFRCYNWLVDGLSSRGYIDEALCVYDLMRDRGVPPTIHLLKTLVFMLCRSGRVEEAELLSLEMESLGFFLDKVMYTALINGYCQKGSMRMGMRLFYRMLKMGCHPDSYTCNTLMHGFLKLGMFDKMSVLLLQMEELGLKPNVVSYQITISKYCKDRKVDYALKLLNSMIQCNLAPTVYCYTPLLAALYKENQLAEVDQLYNQLSDRGLLPDEVLFFTVVKNHVEGHEINLAHKFVAEFARNGCGIDLSDICSTSSKSADDIMLEIDLLLEEIFSRNSGLARVAFNIYMIALCYGGRLEAALLCMDKMSNLSLQPSLPAYNSMVRCLYQKGRGEDAKSLVKVMQDQGLVPSMLTFLIMANEQCKQGDLPSAIGILDQLEDSGVKPSVAIYDSIIGCLAREKRIPKALELFARMHEAGILPDETMFVTMINGLSKDGRAFAAHELFKKMSECGIRPGYRAYTALINGFVKKNMIAEGRLYLDRMLKEGFMPNAALYTSLINQFLRKGEIEFALQLDDLMKRSQIEQDMITHVALVSGVCRNVRYISRKWHGSQRQFEKEKRKLYRLLCQYTNFPKGKGLKNFFSSRKERKVFALKMMDKVKETNFLPNLYLHNGVIAGYCWANNMQGAHCYLDMIMRKGLLPNHVTFTILIDGHIRSGNIDLAVNLFNNMNEHGCVPDNIVYNTLIRGFCKAGRLLDALSISNTMLKKGLSPSKASYENLLQCFCANNWTVHALKILEDMLAHEYIPCGFNLKSLVCILREENKCTEAYIVQTLKSRRRVLQFTGGEEKYLDEDYVRFLQCLQCEGYALKPLNRLFSDNKYVEYDRDDSEDVEVGNTLYEDSQFRQEITNILERPYDQTEYEKHLQDVKVQKPVERKLDLRYGRERWCPLTRIGKSYHDYFDGRTMVINVEYNQLDPLLRARGYPDGDVNCEKGYSPFPGNINQLIIEIGPYIEELTKTGEAIKEFVNPKYKDASKTAFKSSIRLECMMQDFILKHCPLLLESDLLWWMCGLLMHL